MIKQLSIKEFIENGQEIDELDMLPNEDFIEYLERVKSLPIETRFKIK